MSSNAEVEQTDRGKARIVEFGPFQYDMIRREVCDRSGPLRIGSRALELLGVLLESPGRLYSREELVSRVWPCTVVEETSLRVHMSALRRALGDGQHGARYIANVPGRGYAFVGEVKSLMALIAPPVPSKRHAPIHGLPARLTRPIGRDQVIAQIGELCTRERMVSVVGAGGMGKTTAVCAVVEIQNLSYEHGAIFVDLSRLSDPTLVVVEVSRSQGLNATRDDLTSALEGALRNKHMLVVLDNCEHVIDAVAALVDRILRCCPKVHFIATSREPLEVETEWIFKLPPLGMPQADEALEPDAVLDYPAVQLFVERARATCDSFELTDSNVMAIRQLCQFLDGIPLAIELAAARVDTLGVHGLLCRLESMFELLTRSRRTALTRHRTLHAVLNWSYDLLSVTERLVLQRISAFRSAFDLEGAITVASCPGLSRQQVIDDLLSLCAKSLVVLEPADEQRLIYRLLYITRLFAEKQLARDPDEAMIRRRHAQVMLETATKAQQAGADMSQYRWTSSLASCIADLRAAIEWAMIEECDLPLGIEITAESHHMFYDACLIEEYRRLINTALDKIGRAGRENTRLEFKLRIAQSILFAHAMAKGDEQPSVISKTRHLATTLGSPEDQIEALFAICAGAFGQGDYLGTLTYCHEIRLLAQGDLEPISIAIADRMSAHCLHSLGDHDTSEHLAKRVMAFNGARVGRRFLSEVPFDVSMRVTLSRIHWLRGDFAESWTTVHEALACAEGAHMLAKCLALGMAAIPIAIWKGELDLADKWVQDLSEHASRCGLPYWQAAAQIFRCAIDRKSIFAGSEEALLLDKCAPLADMFCTMHADAPNHNALIRVREGKVGWCAPEVLRLAALAGLNPQQTDSREYCRSQLMQALDIGVSQGAKFWALRIVVSLCLTAESQDPESPWFRDQLLSLLQAIDDGSSQPDLQQARLLALRSG